MEEKRGRKLFRRPNGGQDAKYKLLDQEMEHNLIAYRVAIVHKFSNRGAKLLIAISFSSSFSEAVWPAVRARSCDAILHGK